MATIHRIGEPENPSEARAIRELASALPGDYRVIHNFEPTPGHGRPYEFDIVVVAAGAVPLDLDLLRRELSTPGCEDFMAHPQDAIDTIQKMCAFDPAVRHATMDGVIEDLELIGD